MTTHSFCCLATLVGAVGVTALSGCATAKTAPLALADSEIRFTDFNSSLAMGGDWRMTGDSVGLWLLDSGSGGESPMIFALAADGRPEFIAGDSLGMLLVTGDITAIASVLEDADLD